jgi:anaerobic magnesium-protoporphyrin IX monomethyl ester cyclase
MEESGCFYVNLSIESASASMLKSMKRGYTVNQVRESLAALSRSKIPLSASLMFGAPGETPETIAETRGVLDNPWPCIIIWIVLEFV